MAPESFPQFSLLPHEIQADIWRRATNQAIDTPSVHFLELFAIEPRHYGWQEMSRRVRRMQKSGEADELDELDEHDDHGVPRSINHHPFGERDSFYPPVKLAFPLIFPDTRLSSGYYATGPRLTQVSWMAREEATCGANARAQEDKMIQQLPRIHVDLSENKPTVPVTINTEEDIVYLHQPITKPCVWNAMEYVKSSLMQSNQEHFQTMDIRRILLPFHPEKYTRHCLGCHKLRYHHEQLRKLSVKRSQNRQTRAQAGVKPACKMCRKVRREQQEQQPNPDPAHEATIRKQLLERRMYCMLPEVVRRCIDTNYSLDLALMRSSAPEAAEDGEDDDTVSICSADIDPDDDFAWYNNSREHLVVSFIPYPAHLLSGARLPSRFHIPPEGLIPSYDVPTLTRTQYHPPTSTHRDVDPPTNPTTIQSPTITHHNPAKNNVDHHHYKTNTKPNNNNHPIPIPIPKHGTHPACTTTAFTAPFDDILPSYFPSCSSVHLVDYSLKLRPGITTVPAQGRRWYTGGRDGVFVEVVDPADACWVWEGSRTSSGEGGGDDGLGSDEVEDEVRVVEFVGWLRKWWEGVGYFDVRMGGEDVRTVEVGVVAFLELDGEGRVRSAK